MTTQYQFPNIKTSTIRSGYAVLEIVNGVAEVNKNDRGQMALVESFNGVPVRQTAPMIKKSVKPKHLKAGK